MSTVDWWQKMQVSQVYLPLQGNDQYTYQNRLPAGAIIAPIILSSDKTKLSQFYGDKSMWPVYLTLSNLAKDVRCKVSSHVTVLVGYLPVAKLNCFTDKTRSVARYQLFHCCMSIMLAKVAAAGWPGVMMTCLYGLAH